MSIFIITWIIGDSVTGKVMDQRKQRVNSCCLICDHLEEYTEYVLQFQSDNICELQNNTILESRMWMKAVHTQLGIAFFIFSGLTSLISNVITVFELDISIDLTILTAFRYHTRIGWDTFLHGLISRHIMIYQQDYYSEISSRKLSSRWGAQLIQCLWVIINLHWKHKDSILHKNEAIDQLRGIINWIFLLSVSINRDFGSIAFHFTKAYDIFEEVVFIN